MRINRNKVNTISRNKQHEIYMINKIEELLAEIEAFAPQSAADVEAFRIKILGKKGELGVLMEEFKSVPAEQKQKAADLHLLCSHWSVPGAAGLLGGTHDG